MKIGKASSTLPTVSIPRRPAPTTQETKAPSKATGDEPLAPAPARVQIAHDHELAWLSALVYLPTRSLPESMAAEGYTQIVPISWWLTGTQGVMALKGRRAVIAFRGSESTLDWIVDLLMVPCGTPRRHFGFEYAWRSVFKLVTAYLEQHRSSYDRLELCGHSLGGALAKVAAFDLVHLYPVDAVLTLGAPRVFWGSGVRHYDEALSEHGHRLGDITLSYVNGYDLVAMLPPALLGFVHTKGAYESTSESDGSWVTELLDRIKQRRNQPILPMPPALPVFVRTYHPKPPELRDRVFDGIAAVYCWLEREGGILKAVVLKLLTPFALLFAYLWLLWFVTTASFSHRLPLYREEFFHRTLMGRRLDLPTKSWGAKLGGLVVMVPILVVVGFALWKLATFTWQLMLWVGQTTAASVRQLN